MNVQLEEKEWERLLEMAVLGEYVISAPTGETEYRKVVDKLLARQYELRCPGTEGAEENEIADLHDRVFDRVAAYLARFEEDVRAGD